MRLSLGPVIALAAWAALAAAHPAAGQSFGAFTGPDAQLGQFRSGAVLLYPSGVPGSLRPMPPEHWFGADAASVSVRNVSVPSLTPVLPAPGRRTGAAVLVIPGGANMMLSMGNEGTAVARWLADRGVAAFVLKYRTVSTPADDRAFAALLQDRLAVLLSQKGEGHLEGEELSLADAQAAMRLIAQRAETWGVDRRRLGVLGFSAGAIAGRDLVLGPADTRPAFAGLLYGQMTPVPVPADAPPAFLAVAADDPLFGAQGFGLAQAWRAAGRPVELHFYDKGSHGFGMKRQGSSSDLWPDEFLGWMRGRGLLDAKRQAGPAATP